MSAISSFVTDAIVILVLFAGVRAFRSPRAARGGNAATAAALLAAMALVAARHDLEQGGLVLAALLAGSLAGLALAAVVSTTQIPAMVAAQHGAGGLAALLVSFVELWRGAETGLSSSQALAGLLALIVGAATCSASAVAAAKLGGRLNLPPALARTRTATPALFFFAGLLAVASGFLDGPLFLVALVLAASFAAAGGLLLAAPVGGADMPVLISALNATAGLAAAFCGVILEERLLVVAGAMVAASGSMLTHVMCRAMNRSLVSLFAGHSGAARLAPQRDADEPAGNGAGAPAGEEALVAGVPVSPALFVPPDPAALAPRLRARRRPSATQTPSAQPDLGVSEATTAPVARADSRLAQAPAPTCAPAVAGPAPACADPIEAAAADCAAAQDIIIVPGYGMARARAQFAVASLARQLLDMGKDVRFAVHPVAGRMPGHMHVLLAEADVSYDLLVEMDRINPQFAQADLALVVGACDVVNPAAQSCDGSPISGMPILLAGEAARVLVCNFDDLPGYSGVPNPLYAQQNTRVLLGDARSSITLLSEALSRRSDGATSQLTPATHPHGGAQA